MKTESRAVITVFLATIAASAARVSVREDHDEPENEDEQAVRRAVQEVAGRLPARWEREDINARAAARGCDEESVVDQLPADRSVRPDAVPGRAQVPPAPLRLPLGTRFVVHDLGVDDVFVGAGPVAAAGAVRFRTARSGGGRTARRPGLRLHGAADPLRGRRGMVALGLG